MNDHKKIDLYDLRSSLTEEECLVQDTVARFIDQDILPIIGEHFAAHTIPTGLAPKMGKLGLLGANLKGYGCAGLSQTAYGLICQELERGDSTLRSLLSVQSSLVMWCIHQFGSEAHKERWLPAMVTGESLGCFGLTEPQGGSDPANMKTNAKREGDNWILNGSKMWITNGTLAEVAVVWARTVDGIRGFLVETDRPGFEARSIKNKFSLRASDTAELFFSDISVPDENRLPGAEGLKSPLACLEQARYGVAWGAIGAAQACLEEALDYTATRTLFKRPLSKNQLIQTRLADAARRITNAQVLALQMARLKEDNSLSTVQISLAKWNNVRMALDIARDCRDMLGGAGISVEHVAIRHMLNLESVITYEGTESIHQLVVGRELTGESAF
ncbi:MAG: acyl-CoA dehydrogenase family protein [Gammaproteobacteria bacterium]|nr:acyl-CoA dehydrogenase family protein [Gammaproteobacteria bacterium]